MQTVSPNQIVTYTVEVFGAGGVLIPAVLSAATLSVSGGGPIAAAVSGQNLSATVPAGTALGAGTLAWAWTQAAGGTTSVQAISEDVTVVASGETAYGQAAVDLATARLSPYQAAAGDDAPDLGPAIAAELALAAARLRGRFRCVRDYIALSPSDQAAFDAAVGLAASISLLMPTAAGAGGGLSKLKADVYEYTFVTPDADEQARWAEELTDAVSRLSCVQNARVTQSQTLSVINVNGRTREREAAGRYTLTRLVAALLPAGWGGDRRSWTLPPSV